MTKEIEKTKYRQRPADALFSSLVQLVIGYVRERYYESFVCKTLINTSRFRYHVIFQATGEKN